MESKLIPFSSLSDSLIWSKSRLPFLWNRSPWDYWSWIFCFPFIIDLHLCRWSCRPILRLPPTLRSQSFRQTKDERKSAHFVGLPTSPAICPGPWELCQVNMPLPLDHCQQPVARETLHYFTYFLVQLFIIAPGSRH